MRVKGRFNLNLANKKVLVTGSDGFIGSHLVEALLEKGISVRAFVFYNSFNSWGWLNHLSANKPELLEIFLGDIRDPNGVMEAMKGIDVVFHLAALIAIPFSYHSPDSYVDTNIKGTLNVLQAVKRNKVKRMIHTSTSEVYGSAQYVPIDELHPIRPQSPYAATKSAADDLALSFYRSFNLPVTILRPFNTFGPRQSARAVIPTILSQICSNKDKLVIGNTDAVRDFNYVADTVNAFISLSEANDEVNGNVYNAGSGLDISIKDILEVAQAIANKKIEIVVDNARLRPKKSEVDRLLCNSEKIKSICNWKSQTSLEDGLKATYEWMKLNLNKYKTNYYNI